MGEVIDLFNRPKPPTQDEEAWSWGREFVDSGILTLVDIVAEMEVCETEAQLFRCIGELKREVESYPDGA